MHEGLHEQGSVLQSVHDTRAPRRMHARAHTTHENI